MDKYSFLNAAHTSYLADLYDQYLTNPDAIEPSWRSFFQGYNFGFLFMRYAAVSVAVFLFAVIGGQYTYFSDNVVYGSKLYDFKQTLETVRLGMAKTPLQRVDVYSDLAQRRLAEAETLARSSGQQLSFNLIKTALAQGEALTPLTITLGAYEYNNNQALGVVEEMSVPEEIEVVLDVLEIAQEKHEEKLETIAKKVGLANQDDVVVTVAVVLEETKINKSRVRKAAKLVKETVETKVSLGQSIPALQVRLRPQENLNEELGVSDEEQKEQAKAKLALLTDEVQKLKDILETDPDISFEDQRALNILEDRLQKTEEVIKSGQINEADKLIQSTAAVKNNLLAFKQVEPTTYSFKVAAGEEVENNGQEEINEVDQEIAVELPATSFTQEEPVLVLTWPEAVSEPTLVEENVIDLRPDLIITDLIQENANIVKVRVKNQGTGNVVGGYPIQIRLYDRSTGITYFESIYQQLSAGASTFSDPIELATRKYNFLAEVDIYSKIRESNENNNTLEKQIDVESRTSKLSINAIGSDGETHVGEIADLLALNVKAQESDIIIRHLELNRLGTAYDSDLSDWQLYVNHSYRASGSQMGNVIQFYNLNARVPAGAAILIDVRAKVKGSGRTVYLGLQRSSSITAYVADSSYIGWEMATSLPVYGRSLLLQPASTQPEPQSDAELEVTLSPGSPSSQSILPGDQGKTVAILRFRAKNSNINLKKFEVVKQKTSSHFADFETIKIYINGQHKAHKYLGSSSDGVFDFSGIPIYITKDTYLDMELRADYLHGMEPGQWVSYGIYNNDNLVAEDADNNKTPEIDMAWIVSGARHTIVGVEPEPDPPCTETDDGEDPNTKGITTGHWLCPEDGEPIVTETDYCVGSHYVNEYLCNRGCNNILSTSIYCPNGCSDGACLSEPGPQASSRLQISSIVPDYIRAREILPGARNERIALIKMNANEDDIYIKGFRVKKGPLYHRRR